MIEVDRWLTEHAAELGIDPTLVNPGSVDLRLGHKIIEMKSGRPNISYTLADGEEFEFLPGSLYIAHTVETVSIPETHRAQVLCKSSTARRGLNHLMAGLCDGGFVGTITLELVAYVPVTFRAGQRIIQLEFARYAERPERPYSVTGRYMNQSSPQLARPEREA